MADQAPAVGMERKLAAIFSTDVAGYSRLMGDDEEATIRTLTASRQIISSLIQQYRGRVVDAPGDNLLAEFASVVDAVRCAVEIQHALTEKNAELPERRRMQFRIGINLGDVIVEGERLYGDGVNIAARLESLAIPGGICISGTVYDQIETKLLLNYDYQGEQTVKNIAKPVRVYRVAIEVPSELTHRAIALNDSLSVAHVLLGDIYLWKKQHELAIAELERAIVLDPSNAFGYSDLGMILNFAGRPEEALGLEENAMRLDPHYPAIWLWMLGHAYRLTGRYEEAIVAQKGALARDLNTMPSHLELAIISFGKPLVASVWQRHARWRRRKCVRRTVVTAQASGVRGFLPRHPQIGRVVSTHANSSAF